MVHIIMGPEGSGKTKMLIDAIHQALKEESGSMVCIEKGSTLRFDVDHRVRLIDAGEYARQLYVPEGLYQRSACGKFRHHPHFCRRLI